MNYMGSKNRIAKDILPIILANRRDDQVYVEPFCGGCNLIDKVPQGAGRIANDAHVPLINLLCALQEGWLPPEVVSEQEYQAARSLEDTDPIKGFIGFCASYSGKWFGGFARGNNTNGSPRNYSKEAYNNLLAQMPNLLGIAFTCGSYLDLLLPPKSLIYCDPPYRDATGYKGVFDHEAFYDWCRAKRDEGHTVFVSEYQMPEDFTCLWQKEQVSSLTQDTGSKKAVEKLFTIYEKI